jgi:CMP/dCMP kinase
MIIAIDGPTASGKGTVAAGVAKHYGLKRLDTGSLYRAVGLAVTDAGGDPADERTAVAAAEALDLAAIDEHRIRSSAAGLAASSVAAIPAVRAVLRKAQRAFAANPAGAVLDGRDIGTVICPDAEVKLFVTASPEARTQRRLNELRARGEQISFEELQAQIAERDRRDMERKDSPLSRAPDAHLLDTTHLSIEGAVEAACRIIDAALKARPGT